MAENKLLSVLEGVAKTAASVATHGATDQLFDMIAPGLSPAARDELAKARQEQAAALDAARETTTQKAVEAYAQVISSVNDTMQAEAKSEHWLQWAWRPIVGLTLSAIVLNNYFLVAYFAPLGVKAIDIPPMVWSTLLAVVGVSAVTRGIEKIKGQGASGETD